MHFCVFFLWCGTPVVMTGGGVWSMFAVTD